MKFTNEQIEQGLDKIFDNLLQTKDVEASESMEITPDEGYAGIKKVNLTVKGGGGSGSEELMYYRYEYPYLNYEDMADQMIIIILRACSFTSFVDDKGRQMEFPGMYQVNLSESENPAYNSVDALLNLRYKERIVAVSCAKNFKFTIINTEMPKMVLNNTNGVIGLVEIISNFAGVDEELRNACIARATSIFTPITKEEYEALISA